MGGYTKLKSVVEKYVVAEDALSKDEKDKVKEASRIFRVAAILCLFEIAGNLDTIALCNRAIVEQLEKIANKTGEISPENVDQIIETVKKVL